MRTTYLSKAENPAPPCSRKVMFTIIRGFHTSGDFNRYNTSLNNNNNYNNNNDDDNNNNNVNVRGTSPQR